MARSQIATGTITNSVLEPVNQVSLVKWHDTIEYAQKMATRLMMETVPQMTKALDDGNVNLVSELITCINIQAQLMLNKIEAKRVD